ncbi:MAG: hypothetical protein SGJ19_09360, partial [Planctomycetia bacterium]|nr:hypothetical protein [Planctomycetia bacterium]
LDEWAEQPDPFVAARHQATTQLQGLMNAPAAPRRNWRYLVWGAAVAIAAVLGVAAAQATRTPPLVTEQDAKRFPTKASADLQMLAAIDLATVEAWQAVLNYPKVNEDHENYVWIAKRELVRLYLRQPDLESAQNLSKSLATSAPEEKLQAFGIAGECIVLGMRGNWHDFRERLNALATVDALDDPEIQEMLNAQKQASRSATAAPAPVIVDP